jgi:hypothetical protein
MIQGSEPLRGLSDKNIFHEDGGNGLEEANF